MNGSLSLSLSLPLLATPAGILLTMKSTGGFDKSTR